jgi:hypothetical protein
MTNDFIHSDISEGLAVEVVSARAAYFDSNLGLTVRQSFFIYGNGRVACVNFTDGRETTHTLSADDEITFHAIYLRFAA